MCLWCEQFWRCWVQNIHRSFVGWPGRELRMPTTYVLPRRRIGLCAPSSSTEAHSGQTGFREKAAWGRTPLHVAAMAATFGRVAAAQFLLSKGAAVDAKDDDGRVPQSGKAPDIESRRLGHLRRLFRDWNLCIFRNCLAKLWVFRTKKRRERWSQCNMPIMCGKRMQGSNRVNSGWCFKLFQWHLGCWGFHFRLTMHRGKWGFQSWIGFSKLGLAALIGGEKQ